MAAVCKAVGRIAASDLNCLKLSWMSNCFVAVKAYKD